MERRSSSRLDQVGDSDDEDDIKEENEEVAAIEAGRALVEADLEDYQKITLPRRRLGRWCNEPYFKEAVMNCYVKLFIGENDQGKRCYRLCKIIGVGTTKPYLLPPVKNQKPVCICVSTFRPWNAPSESFEAWTSLISRMHVTGHNRQASNTQVR